MQLGELKSLTDRVELSMGVTFFAVKSVEQTLSREKWLAPGYVTQPRSKVRIRSVASPMGRRYIQFSDGSLQSRLTLRVAVCD